MSFLSNILNLFSRVIVDNCNKEIKIFKWKVVNIRVGETWEGKKITSTLLPQLNECKILVNFQLVEILLISSLELISSKARVYVKNRFISPTYLHRSNFLPRKKEWYEITSTLVALSFSSITCLRIVSASLHASCNVIDCKVNWKICVSIDILYMRHIWVSHTFTHLIKKKPTFFCLFALCQTARRNGFLKSINTLTSVLKIHSIQLHNKNTKQWTLCR